jgi:glycosyltransferase involved in cell wall biosynthesis
VKIAEIAPPWFPVPPPGYGGIELVVKVLADGLQARGHDVTLFAPIGSESEAEVVSPLRPAGAEQIGEAWFEAHHALSAYLQREQFEVIHDHTFMGSALAAVAGEPPVVHTLHGPWTPESRRYYALVHERIHLVAISESQRGGYEDVRYAAVVPNGIDLSAYRVGEEPREDFLVYIGRANEDKAPEDAVALAHLAGRPLKLVCKHVEPQEIEYWERAVEPVLGPDDEVLGEIGHDEKVALLQSGSAFVFPIRWEEPFGLVVIEAMACGMPVVARPRGAVADLVVDGETGFLDDDLDRLAASLDRLDTISADACHARVERHFSADAMVSGYEELFARLAESRSSTGARGRPNKSITRASQGP